MMSRFSGINRKQKGFLVVIVGVAIIACSYFYFYTDTDIAGANLKKKETSSLKSVFLPDKGWSAQKLEAAKNYANEMGSSAVIVIHDAKLVAEWGETTKRIKSHSVRKSLLSALYGIAVGKGLINMSDTMEVLGIDDKPPSLTKKEKQARISDLIKARSGIYHPAAAEAPEMKKRRPGRGSHPRGSFWYYNNWDFNALGTIFEQKTGLPIGEAFKKWISDPIGMEDFRAKDVKYEWDSASKHPAYPFWISARDLSRFGVLFLQLGIWKGKQVVPKSWILESVTEHTRFANGGGYGYMWWILKSGAYEASGTGFQKIHIDPDRKIVIVNRVDTSGLWWYFGDRVTNKEFKKLIGLIYEAYPFEEK